jgi:hypothetical protein
MSAVWGVNWDGVQRGLPEGNYDFAITDYREGTDRVGDRTMQFQCTVESKNENGRVHWAFHSFAETRIYFLKRFIEELDRPDVLKPEQGPQDLLHTRFNADVVYTESKDGRLFANLRNVRPLKSNRPGPQDY